MDRYLKRRSLVIEKFNQQNASTNINNITSDSGVRNTNTSEAGASGQADTFDDDLQIDEEELDRVMEEGKRVKVAQEAVRNRERNEGDFNLFSTQSTTAMETVAEPRFQRAAETHWQSFKWSQTSSEDSQTSTVDRKKNKESSSKTKSNSVIEHQSRSMSMIDFMYEDERQKIAQHVERCKNDGVPNPPEMPMESEKTPDNPPVALAMPEMPARQSSSMSEIILQTKDSTLVGLGNSKALTPAATHSVTDLLNSTSNTQKSTNSTTVQKGIIATSLVNPRQTVSASTTQSEIARIPLEQPIFNGVKNIENNFRVPDVPSRKTNPKENTSSSDQVTTALPNSTSSSSNSRPGTTITTSATTTSIFSAAAQLSQKSLCIYRSKSSLSVAVFDDEKRAILWFENQLQSLSLDEQVDNLLLPLLFKHEPRFLVVCGNKEDTLLASLQKVSKKRFAAADYRPPQLIRLNHSEFHTPKCQARIRESMKIDRDSGNSIHTRCAIPSDCTIAIRSVGALIGFVKRANSYGPLRFEPLSLVTACGIGSNVLQYLRITAQRGHTETTLFSVFRSIKGIGLQKRLRKFLQTPVADIEIIKRRQTIFELFIENGFLRRDLLLVCERFSVPKKIISAAGMSKTGHTVRKNHQFWSQVVTAVRNITEVQISRKSIPAHIKGLKISTINEDLFRRIQNVGASIEELIDFDQSKKQKTVVLNTESTELARVRRILLMEARIPSIIKHGQMDIDLLYAELGLKLRHMREIGFYLEKKFDGDMTDNGVQKILTLYPELIVITKFPNSVFFRSGRTASLNAEVGDPKRQVVEIKDEVQRILLAKIKEISCDFEAVGEAIEELALYLHISATMFDLKLKKPQVIENEEAMVRGKGIWNIVKAVSHPLWRPQSFATTSRFRKTILIYGEKQSGKTDLITSVATCVYLTHLGMFVPADFFGCSIFSRIECLTPVRMVAQADQISQFGTDIAALNQSICALSASSAKTLCLMDNWGHGTRHEDKLVLSAFALSTFAQAKHCCFLACTRDLQLAQFTHSEFSDVLVVRISKQDGKLPKTEFFEEANIKPVEDTVDEVLAQTEDEQFPKRVKELVEVFKEGREPRECDNAPGTMSAAQAREIAALYRHLLTVEKNTVEAAVVYTTLRQKVQMLKISDEETRELCKNFPSSIFVPCDNSNIAK